MCCGSDCSSRYRRLPLPPLLLWKNSEYCCQATVIIMIMNELAMKCSSEKNILGIYGIDADSNKKKEQKHIYLRMCREAPPLK